MRKESFLLAVLAAVATATGAVHRLPSPDGALTFTVSTDGDLVWSLAAKDRELVTKSELGFTFVDEQPMRGAFELAAAPTVERGCVEAWKPVVKNRHAEVNLVYNRMVLPLREKGGERRRMDLTVHVYDGGAAFRYTLYGSARLGERLIKEELTAYRVPPTSSAWIGSNAGKAFAGSQESVFTKTPVTEIPADAWCLSPLVVEIDRTHYLALTSAALDNYPGFYTAWRDGALVTRLAPSPAEGPDGVKARFDGRFDTAWRVVLVADTPGRFMESEIIPALNPPCAIADTSWIKPGISAWDHWWSADVKMEMPAIKAYIDLAAAQGWPYMLLDWQWYGPFNTPDADITRPAPQLDMAELVAYAKARGVRLLLWLYSSDVTRNDAYLDAFKLYRQWGIAGVKIDFMDRYDREIVNWYRRMTQTATENQLLINFHGAYAPDGMDRTWPNQITREGVLGEEYAKFSGLVTPAHNVTLAFTRLAAGAMDYTPGGFLNVSNAAHICQSPTCVANTRAAELAKFVVYESPLTVCCEHPSRLRGHPGAEFLARVPTTWDDTRFLGGYPGEWVAVARRDGAAWYVGVMGGDDAREVTIDLGWTGTKRQVAFWADGDAPDRVTRGVRSLPADGRLTLRLAPGGGWVGVVTAAEAPKNGERWFDTNGQILNAHGSGVLAHDGRYYLFGEHKVYGEAGNSAHVGVHVYSSDDLCLWQDEGLALAVSNDAASDIADGCILERPKVIHCAKTGQFVMYFHLERRGHFYTDARVGIAVADRPAGPYTFLRSTKIAPGTWPVNVRKEDQTPEAMARSLKEWEVGCGRYPQAEKALIYPACVEPGQDSRDMTLFVDDDGTGWLIHSSERNSTLHITELTDDYLGFTGRWWRVMEKEWTEAPAVCKKDGWYYLIGSDCTGWAPNTARLYRAKAITGPWERLGNPCRGVNPANGLGPEKTWGGQSNFILKTFDGRFIAMFDLWNPQNQIDSRLVWLPVVFGDGELSIDWKETFE